MSYSNASKINASYEIQWQPPKKIPIPRTDKNWAKSNKALKDHIRYHYSVVQDNKCAYCRLPIRFAGYGEPIEHIVPKSLNSHWMYHPKNLCLACFGCNTYKLDKETLMNDMSRYSKKYADYRMASTDYKIVHPHFDRFSDYIEINKFVYRKRPGSGNKGLNTINICNINRLDVMYERARSIGKSKVNINQIAVKIIASRNSSAKEIAAAQMLLDELISRFKYKQSL